MQKFNNKKILRKINCDKKIKRILVVTGLKTSTSINLKFFIKKNFYDKEITFFFKKKNNPELSELNNFFSKKIKKIDLIVAVGGGSVIDFAKLVNYFDKKNLKNYKIKNIEFNKSLNKKIKNKILAIPTTTGSGSESTHFAVIYSNNKKYSISNKNLKPKYKLHHKPFLLKMPQQVFGSSLVDAICQAIESFWSNNSNNISKSYSLKSMKINSKKFPRFIINSKNIYQHALAAMYAGEAINITKTSAPHALSYYLSRKIKVPHGFAVGLLMPFFFEINFEYGSKMLKNRMTKIFKIFNFKNLSDSKKKWNLMLKRLGQKKELSDYLREKKILIKDIINNANTERLKNHPVYLSKKILSSKFNASLINN